MRRLKRNRFKRRPPFVLLLIAAACAAALLLPLARGQSPIDFGLDLSGGVIVTYRPDFSSRLEAYAEVSDAELLALAKETLESRLHRSLRAVPDVVVRGGETIVASIPGGGDQQRVLELVGKTYQLSLRLVTQAHDSEVAGSELHPYRGRHLELAPAEFSGDMLDERRIRVETGASGELDPMGDAPRVAFAFAPPHDGAFARFTGDHVGEELAILLDGEVEWAGTIESAIDGPGVLRGHYTLEEATEVARMLRSGSLPVSLEVESLAAVGPRLGQEVRDLGLSALALSLALLAAVLAAAYLHRAWLLIAGLLSLGFLLFYVAGLAAILRLTLDMAGIAGLVLSVGMGMDAFILIFEALDRRIREATPRQIRDDADRMAKRLYSFAREGRVLLHANATTAVVVAWLLASERLASFALFMFVGILASVLTIFTTREVLQRTRGLAGGLGPDLLGWIRRPRPGVFRLRRAYFALLAAGLGLTALLILAGVPGGPALELGADFRPGTQAMVESPEEEGVRAVVSLLRERLPGVEIKHQRLGEPEDGRYLLTLGAPLDVQPCRGGPMCPPALEGGGVPDEERTGLDAAELARVLAVESVTLESVGSIDSRVSADRLVTALSVLILSFACLAGYFVVLQGPINEALGTRAARPVAAATRLWIFGGILLAVVVDVAVVLAAAAWLGIDLGLPVVAALLTVVGYSVNDSVVLWSHVRGVHREAAELRPAREVVSAAVDRILSRAGLTSLSTMVPALAILIVGLEPLAGFAWAMIAGTLAGTLSSIFIVGAFAARALEREAVRPLAATARGASTLEGRMPAG